ncbi:MAG TPA: hypothetical protein VFH58_05545 [Acidimicrobiales bacterium]|nr:hypothetical protein [Acidimicrobiales bacterium]
MEPTPTLARRLWHAVEPLHAAAYFHPSPTDALKDLGLKGFWMCYFAGRFAPLGAIGPEPATAMAFGFAPRLVARALPDAWRLAAPEDILTARREASAGVLREHAGASDGQLEELAGLLETAVGGCRYDGRPLAAGWLEVDAGNDVYAAVWTRATVIREHRGDGHVLAAVSLGLRGLDATLTHVATGAIARDLMLHSRGWTQEEWEEGERRLEARGLTDRDGRLTRSGGALRRQLEETTDRLASGPVERLGQTGVERIIELATPISRRLIDAGVVPVPNPIGVPRP